MLNLSVSAYNTLRNLLGGEILPTYNTHVLPAMKALSDEVPVKEVVAPDGSPSVWITEDYGIKLLKLQVEEALIQGKIEPDCTLQVKFSMDAFGVQGFDRTSQSGMVPAGDGAFVEGKPPVAQVLEREVRMGHPTMLREMEAGRVPPVRGWYKCGICGGKEKKSCLCKERFPEGNAKKCDEEVRAIMAESECSYDDAYLEWRGRQAAEEEQLYENRGVMLRNLMRMDEVSVIAGCVLVCAIENGERWGEGVWVQSGSWTIWVELTLCIVRLLLQKVGPYVQNQGKELEAAQYVQCTGCGAWREWIGKAEDFKKYENKKTKTFRCAQVEGTCHTACDYCQQYPCECNKK